MRKLKVAVIGCGGIANQKHFPALKNNSDLNEIVAFCDIIRERAEKAAAEFGTPDAKVYMDYRELLKDKKIDVVHICTPNVSHSEIAIASFEAEKHVYCEKPMSHSTQEAEKMVEAWKKSGMQFTVGYQNRFRPEVMNLHAACEKGELGDIYYGKAHAVRRRGVPTWGVFMDKAAQGGGPLIDIGTHALDITLWCMNNYDIDSVTGSVFYKLGGLEQATEGNLFGPWDPETYEVEDSAMGFIKMKNGATIALEASWALNILESREASTTLCGFDIRLSYYRGHFLSVIDEFGVKLDGEEIPEQDIRFCINGKEFGISQLHDLVSEFWPVTVPATVKVFKNGGIPAGEHDVEVKLMFHSPYMPISDTDYMPIDSCGSKRLTLAEF